MKERDPVSFRAAAPAHRVSERQAPRRARLRAVLLIAALTLSGDPAQAQTAFWIENGSNVIGKCPGRTEGEPMKAANGSNESVLLTGIVTCTDTGDAYVFRIEHLSVSINPRMRTGIRRPTLHFDWIGLAVYAGRDGDRAVDWLYDDAMPINGSLEASDTRRIYFGRISFTVPKRDIARATRFTFYMTAQGLFFDFRLL